MSIDYRPDDPRTLANPYPLFAQMRDEDPCHPGPPQPARKVRRKTAPPSG